MDLNRTNLIFVYGTLKRLADLIRSGEAAFFAAGRTAIRLPLIVGPFSIPFLLRLPASGCRVKGELYTVSSRGLARLDELEGVVREHYERLPLDVVPVPAAPDGDAREVADPVAAEAYFAHRSFAEDMWRRCEEKGLDSYSEVQAERYIRPKDRAAGATFLGEVRRFIASPN